MGYPMGYPIPKVSWDGIGMGPWGGPYLLNGMVWDYAGITWQTKPNMASVHLIIDIILLPLEMGSGSLIPYHPMICKLTLLTARYVTLYYFYVYNKKL